MSASENKNNIPINKIMNLEEKREFKQLYELFAEFDTDGNGEISLLVSL